MRPVVFAILLCSSALALDACATAGGERSTSAALPSADMARLKDQCDARGGILAPTGATTGEAALDNACYVTEDSTERPSRD